MSTGRKHKQYLARAHAMGGSTTVPAAEAVPVLVELSQRMSYSAIGRALGTSHNYVTRVIAGDIKRMQPSRRDAILALANHRPTDTSHISARGTARRLQALHALGYSLARLEREVGCYSLGAIKDVVHGRVVVIEAQHAVAVAEAYERLSMRLPQATNRNEASGITRARNTAKRNGWAPPLAWDDIDTDERAVGQTNIREVDPVLVDRILAGDFAVAKNATKAEKQAVMARWRASGRGVNELGRLTGWSKPERYGEREAS